MILVLRFAKFLIQFRPNLANLYFKKKLKTLLNGSTLIQNLRQTFDLINSHSIIRSTKS